MEKWELVADLTHRLKVPGGWLYRYHVAWDQPTFMIFVPEPK